MFWKCLSLSPYFLHLHINIENVGNFKFWMCVCVCWWTYSRKWQRLWLAFSFFFDVSIIPFAQFAIFSFEVISWFNFTFFNQPFLLSGNEYYYIGSFRCMCPWVNKGLSLIHSTHIWTNSSGSRVFDDRCVFTSPGTLHTNGRPTPDKSFIQ